MTVPKAWATVPITCADCGQVFQHRPGAWADPEACRACRLDRTARKRRAPGKAYNPREAQREDAEMALAVRYDKSARVSMPDGWKLIIKWQRGE